MNLDNFSKKKRNQKIFFNPNSTLDDRFGDIIHISDNEYIDRPKLSQQKNPFEFIVPPLQVGIRRSHFPASLRHEGNSKKHFGK